MKQDLEMMTRVRQRGAVKTPRSTIGVHRMSVHRVGVDPAKFHIQTKIYNSDGQLETSLSDRKTASSITDGV